MSSQPVPEVAPTIAQPWLRRLGLSGKLMIVGGIAGIVAAFLPLVTVSIQFASPFALLGPMYGLNTPRSHMVVEDWRGAICLLTYIAAVALAFVLYPRGGLTRQSFSWTAVAAGVLATVLAIWMLVLVGSSENANPLAAVTVTTGIGAILNLLAGLVVTAAGFLKVREHELL